MWLTISGKSAHDTLGLDLTYQATIEQTILNDQSWYASEFSKRRKPPPIMAHEEAALSLQYIDRTCGENRFDDSANSSEIVDPEHPDRDGTEDCIPGKCHSKGVSPGRSIRQTLNRLMKQ